MHGGARPGAGRKRWEPTERDRRQAEAMASYGLSHEEIAKMLDVDADTLKKHCRRELDTGALKVHAQMGQMLVATISGRQPGENAWPIIHDDGARSRLLIFYLKTRMGWKDTTIVQHRGDKDNPVEIRLHDDENRLWVSAQLDRLEKAEAVARKVARPVANGEDRET
jgi:hypothetical protein